MCRVGEGRDATVEESVIESSGECLAVPCSLLLDFPALEQLVFLPARALRALEAAH